GARRQSGNAKVGGRLAPRSALPEQSAGTGDGSRARAVLKLQIRPLTPDLWPALEDLFGEQGAYGGCWCMYWRIGSAYQKRPRDQNKADFRAVVRRGPPPGLLAFNGELPVGWCQLTPRDALPRLDHARSFVRVDDVPVWCISCF